MAASEADKKRHPNSREEEGANQADEEPDRVPAEPCQPVEEIVKEVEYPLRHLNKDEPEDTGDHAAENRLNFFQKAQSLVVVLVWVRHGIRLPEDRRVRP